MGNLGCHLYLQWPCLAQQFIALYRNYFLVGPSLVNNFQSTLEVKSVLMLLIIHQKKQTSCPSFISPSSLWILATEQWK